MKRSKPLKTSGFRQAEAKASMPVARARCKAKGCNARFVRLSMKHRACSTECAIIVRAQDKAEEVRKAAVAERKADNAKREAMKKLGDLRKEAQTEFNRYIRFRDRLAGHGCICCDAPLDWNSTKHGGAVDAGHFVSRGSAPELAFDERNVNAQRKSCNRPGGATRSEFVAGMVRRYGVAVVDELEGPNPPKRFRHDDYRQIKSTYRAKANALARELERSQG